MNSLIEPGDHICQRRLAGARTANNANDLSRLSRKADMLQRRCAGFRVMGCNILKGYSAAVQSVVSILRNLTAVAGREEKWLQYLWVVLGVVLGLYFNNRGLFGWLPVVANLEYSVAVFKFKDDERALKIAFCINVILFTIFNAGLFNIVGVCCSTVVLVTTIMSLVNGKKEKNSL